MLKAAEYGSAMEGTVPKEGRSHSPRSTRLFEDRLASGRTHCGIPSCRDSRLLSIDYSTWKTTWPDHARRHVRHSDAMELVAGSQRDKSSALPRHASPMRSRRWLAAAVASGDRCRYPLAQVSPLICRIGGRSLPPMRPPSSRCPGHVELPPLANRLFRQRPCRADAP